MLKPKTLTQVLGQANTSGVSATMLINRDGVLLAMSGVGIDTSVSAPIAASLWKSLETPAVEDSQGQEEHETPVQKELVFELQEGYIAIRPVANVLLAMFADKSVQQGMLRIKLKTVGDYLEEPLKQVAQAQGNVVAA